MLKNLFKTPFPYFGGKSDAALAVWEALGDVSHYVEPFCGSLAVLMRRPHPCNRTYFSETVNDADGFLVNVWRSIQMSPQETAEWASWPVTEADITARHLWLVNWQAERHLEHLMANPDWHDPRAAGYWLYGICGWIGSGWCDGKGKWVVGDDGRITEWVVRRTHLSSSGQGMNNPGTREPGVAVQLPHLTNDGRGVNRPQARESGVGDFHPMTMPELMRWFEFLSARLRHVRIVNGDWKRVCTTGALKMLEVRMNKGKCGIFFDPPYGHKAKRCKGLYAKENLDVAEEVLEWCIANGDDTDYRIVLAGFDGEHNVLEQHGWRVAEWFKKGFLKGGMAQIDGKSGGNQHRERLWMSPHCLNQIDIIENQYNMFALDER